MADPTESPFEVEPGLPAPLPSDLQARFNGAYVIPYYYVPKEAPVAEAVTVTPAAAPAASEPTKPSTKVIVAKACSALVAVAVLVQVISPSGLVDTIAGLVEFVARQFAG